jgi:malonyl-CoA/methylmalonyl-CoA synthetase
MNLLHLLAIAERRAPGKTALQFTRPGGDPMELSYRELHQASRRLAAGFRNWGLRKGDRVAFFLGNRPEFVTTYLALARLGAVIVPLNLAYRRRELSHVLADAQPRLLLTERHQLEILDALKPTDRVSVEELVLAEDLAAWERPESDSRPVVGADDPATIMYTSGTTGRSKGAVISHRNLLASMADLLAAWAWSPQDTLLLGLPLFHTHGLVVGLHCALAAGAKVLLHRRFEAARFVDALAAGKPTLFFGVPTMYLRLIDELRGRPEKVDFSQVRLFCCGSAPLAEETFEEFRKLTGHEILERYGMTETCMLLSNPYDGPRVAGSVGLPLPGVSVRIVDERDRDVAPGDEGELLARGSNVFDGYWQAEDKTAGSFTRDDHGSVWFRTGDLARQDPDSGYFTLLGRRHELIISGGYNIYPREVEEVLVGYAGVRDAAVIGATHPEWGEVPVAFLEVDCEVDQDGLTDYCQRQMAKFKVPQAFEVVDSLPRNALGKVQKHLLTSRVNLQPRSDSNQ